MKSGCMLATNTMWNVSKYGVFSCPYFSVFGLNSVFSPNSVRIGVQSCCSKLLAKIHEKKVYFLIAHQVKLYIFNPYWRDRVFSTVHIALKHCEKCRRWKLQWRKRWQMSPLIVHCGVLFHCFFVTFLVNRGILSKSATVF